MPNSSYSVAKTVNHRKCTLHDETRKIKQKVAEGLSKDHIFKSAYPSVFCTYAYNKIVLRKMRVFQPIFNSARLRLKQWIFVDYMNVQIHQTFCKIILYHKQYNAANHHRWLLIQYKSPDTWKAYTYFSHLLIPLKFQCPPWKTEQDNSPQIFMGFWLSMQQYQINKESQPLSSKFLTYLASLFNSLSTTNIFRIRFAFAHTKPMAKLWKLKLYLQLFMKGCLNKTYLKLSSFYLNNHISKQFIKCSGIWKAQHCLCLICITEKQNSIVIH